MQYEFGLKDLDAQQPGETRTSYPYPKKTDKQLDHLALSIATQLVESARTNISQLPLEGELMGTCDVYGRSDEFRAVLERVRTVVSDILGDDHEVLVNPVDVRYGGGVLLNRRFLTLHARPCTTGPRE